ncbi:ABC transporter substrate-binding protein [Comamonas sp. Y33R10-2]|uniref:Bug family tripartite tricarboxylate transporter substrate binding protein n=1 Tax=Comamonas sp. Y33R10-2 TaxID=2853257 RepID=UPI001C5CA91C|nr:tripartite tricarboxylate transporter substrate-binding protein [Comamonas sp. Y33R10-2]QXZ10567.1 ABC transporter substrate-binding protein [Comamonas sp. Y33R10-2]
MQRRHFLKTSISASLATAVVGVQAQDNSPIKLLVGFAPGGVTDLFARLCAESIQTELGRTVIVENRPGAHGRMATQAVKASAANSHTFLISPNAGLVFLELLFSKAALGYDMLNDLTPVAALSTYPLGMVVNSSTGVTNAKEYVQWVKANPSKGIFGTSGAGSHTHFAGMRLAEAAGINLEVVPYKGNSAVNIDLLGGQIPAASMAASDFLHHKDNPKVKIIGVFGQKRSSLAPDVPTFVEQGFDAVAGDAWMGMWTSKKTPADEVQLMSAVIEKILKKPEFISALKTKMTMAPMYRNSKETDQLQRSELAMWRPIIAKTGFKPE